jgi:hypothetical protein
MKFVQAHEQMATSRPICASFRKAGLLPETSPCPFRLTFDEEEVRDNAGFKQIWDRNIEMEEFARM